MLGLYALTALTRSALEPKLVGRQLDEVWGDKTVTDNFKVVRISVESDDQAPEGEILSQDPEAGTEAELGSTINVVVSGGKEAIEMIDVKNFTYEDAVKAIQGIGLEVDTPEYQPSDDVEEDHVISFTPPKGTKLEAGDTVHLVISQGPENTKVVVPTLTGQSLDKARQMLTDLELKVGSVEEVTSDQTKGLVVYQSIAPGTQVEKGTAITLHYSKGPESQPISSKPVTVTLPEDRETVTVRITVGGKEAYNQTVDTSVGSVVTPVEGTGTQQICVYIDGALVDQYDETFN